MAQIFHPLVNAIGKLFVAGVVLSAVGLFVFMATFGRSAFWTQISVAPEQPVPFSHEYHVDGLDLQCRYCHVYVEESSFAGVPQTEICMGCHSQIWSDSPMLAPVIESYQNDETLEWVRVNDLPDYVFFNHSIHLNKGVACVSCHGKVNEMPLMRKQSTLHMEWCLKCHRNRQDNIRPRAEVFNMRWEAPADPADLAAMQAQLVEDYHVDVEQFNITDCSVCHH